MFKGGGHPLASGASIHSWNEVDDVLEALDEVCENYSFNK
jgi:phosphoesterase RecJ-like protein